MAKFVLQSSERKNSRVVLLHSGETEFNGEGKAEVDITEDQVKDMVRTYEDISVEGFETEEIKPKAEVNELGTGGKEENIGGSGEDEQDELLKGLPFDEVKKLCSESGFPADEWDKLDEQGLKKYVSDKLK